jgi:TRAP-type C4-dicarboxylate transport system permease large subunit
MYKIIKFFDKLEDRVRVFLSEFPIIYSLIGGVFIVVFWRGVWEVFDSFLIFDGFYGGLASLVLSSSILMATGLFVSFFIGDTILMSGIKKEKKIAEKTRDELRKDAERIEVVIAKIENIEKNILEISEKIKQESVQG